MHRRPCPRIEKTRLDQSTPSAKPLGRFLRCWFRLNMLATGVFALVWLILRTGAKPSRWAYPCQQAAASTATLALGAPVVSAALAGRRQLLASLRRPVGIAALAGCVLLSVGLFSYFSDSSGYAGPQLQPPARYRANVYRVTDCPPDPDGTRFAGLDNLLVLMGREGKKFYRSQTESLVSGPDGIIEADNVVVIKINYQWSQRGGTNVDLLAGLIHRIVQHPDGFTGEIVVCENSQFVNLDNFDRSQNNAQDHARSPHDVITEFQTQGHNVSHSDWQALRYTRADEYADGDMADGYIVYDYDGVLHGRISYPKFQSAGGTYISLKYGIWHTDGQFYDRENLKFINLPILKSHSGYGVTACVKHYMGTVTRELNTNSHSAIRYGIMGALQAEIQLADINILDCIWINAIPRNGPGTSYAEATRRDELVASLDPVAADIWATKNILIPAFQDNGYEPPYNYADPDDPNSIFRTYLDNSMNQLLEAGIDVTNNLNRIDAITWNGAGDSDGDSDVDLDDYVAFFACLQGPDVPRAPECATFDFDNDNDVDEQDFAQFQAVFTGAGIF